MEKLPQHLSRDNLFPDELGEVFGERVVGRGGGVGGGRQGHAIETAAAVVDARQRPFGGRAGQLNKSQNNCKLLYEMIYMSNLEKYEKFKSNIYPDQLSILILYR